MRFNCVLLSSNIPNCHPAPGVFVLPRQRCSIMCIVHICMYLPRFGCQHATCACVVHFRILHCPTSFCKRLCSTINHLLCKPVAGSMCTGCILPTPTPCKCATVLWPACIRNHVAASARPIYHHAVACICVYVWRETSAAPLAWLQHACLCGCRLWLTR